MPPKNRVVTGIIGSYGTGSHGTMNITNDSFTSVNKQQVRIANEDETFTTICAACLWDKFTWYH